MATLRAFIQWIPVQIRLGYRPATEMFATFLSHSRQFMVKLPKIKPQSLPYHFHFSTGYHPIIWRYALPQASILSGDESWLRRFVARTSRRNVLPACMGLVVDDVAMDRFFPEYISILLYHFTSAPYLCVTDYIFATVSAVKRHILKDF